MSELVELLMKKLLCLGLIVAAIVFGSFAAYKKYRILPLDEGFRRATVLSAASAECAKNWDWYGDRVLVLQANPNLLTVKVNEEEVTVELSRDILRDVLGVRMDRSLFLVDNDDNASLVFEKILKQLPGVGRICIIDPKHPPAWYPPKPYRGGGHGGAKMAFQMREF
jgi:hypothetical protein